MAELNCASHRPYSSGFYFDELRRHKPDEGAYEQDCVFVGVVKAVSGTDCEVEVRNKLIAGSELEILSPHTVGQAAHIEGMYNSLGEPIPQETRAGTIVRLKLDTVLHPGDFLRIRTKVRTLFH